MAKKKSGGATPAFVQLLREGVSFTERSYEHDPRAASYGLEAAETLGVEPAQVFKTLFADVDGELCVGIVPVDAQLDLKALASALGGKKAAMADPARAERASGYVVGGISPLGQKKAHRTVLDESALAWDSVLVSAGRRGLEAELAPGDLVRITRAIVQPIAAR